MEYSPTNQTKPSDRNFHLNLQKEPAFNDNINVPLDSKEDAIQEMIE